MNREIKFRAWCEGTHEGLTFSTTTMEYGVTLSPKGNYCEVESGWDIHGEYPTVPIMQFTGLTDKNGKDVYEGDVVKCFRNGKHYANDIYFIKYSDNSFIMAGNKESQKMDCLWFYDFEIIGNIYENPELL